MTDSFGARKPLKVGAKTYQIYRLDAVNGPVDTLPYTLKILLENLLRFEDGANITAEDIKALANWDPEGRARPRDRVHARARDPARLHRRAGGRGPRRDARRGREARRQGRDDQPALPGRARDRSLGASRQLRHGAVARAEQRDRVRAQPGALLVPALGPERVRELPRRAAEHGHRAPGEPRVPEPRGVRAPRRQRRRSRIPTRSSAPTRTRR